MSKGGFYFTNRSDLRDGLTGGTGGLNSDVCVIHGYVDRFLLNGRATDHATQFASRKSISLFQPPSTITLRPFPTPMLGCPASCWAEPYHAMVPATSLSRARLVQSVRSESKSGIRWESRAPSLTPDDALGRAFLCQQATPIARQFFQCVESVWIPPTRARARRPRRHFNRSVPCVAQLFHPPPVSPSILASSRRRQ